VWTSFYSDARFKRKGHKPCLEAFGADQFEEDDPVEKKHKSSFFNYWYCGICCGTLLGVIVLLYIQDNVGWGMGFGIVFMTMAIQLFIFLCGTMATHGK
jgi:peptide/histidine transporter 3/4